MLLNLLVGSTLALWFAVIANLLLTLGLAKRINRSRQARRQSGPASGESVADFTATTVAGESVTLQEYSDRPSIFVFVSNQCAPCADAMPRYQQLFHMAAQNNVGVALVSGDQLADATDMVERFELGCPVLVAPRVDNPFFEDWKIEATPTYVAVNEHKVVEAGMAQKSLENWRLLVEKLTTTSGDAQPLVVQDIG